MADPWFAKLDRGSVFKRGKPQETVIDAFCACRIPPCRSQVGGIG
jgi:hypothetical protein